MAKTVIQTANAPHAIGAYSQAIRTGGTVYLSGQIALVPSSMELVSSDIQAQIRQVFDNLQAVATASGGALKDAVKLTVYLCDLRHFPAVNDMMAEFFTPPYPARATVQVAALPRGALVEIDAILSLP
jgi:reactive intermediate/imine deaminase